MFITMGPYQATGSSRGLPETRRKDERAIVGGGGRGGVQPAYGLRGDGEGLAGVAKFAGAGEDVGEGVAGGLDGQSFPAAGGYGNVHIHGIGGDAFDRAALAPETAADQADVRAIVVGDFGNFRRFHFLIARRRHLERGG